MTALLKAHMEFGLLILSVLGRLYAKVFFFIHLDKKISLINSLQLMHALFEMKVTEPYRAVRFHNLRCTQRILQTK